MGQENYILQSFLKRMLKIVINFVIYTICFLVLYFVIFSNVFDTSAYKNLRSETFIESGLYRETSDGIVILTSDNYEDYEKVVKKYYVGKINDEDLPSSYFDTTFYKDHGGTRNAKTVEWYNKNILSLDKESAFFELSDNDINKFGRIKNECYEIKDGQKVLKSENETLILDYFVRQYQSCFVDLQNDEFYKNAIDNQNNFIRLRTFVSVIIPLVMVYLIVPLIFNCDTIGDIITKTKICNKNGLKARRYKLLIRVVVPLILICINLISSNIYVFLSAFVVYLILDLLFMAYSKKKQNISDLLSFTVTVDKTESEIFNTLEEKNEFNKSLEDDANDVSEEYYKEGERKNDE